MNNDTQYEMKASGFLKKVISGLICAAFPIACIVAIFWGAGNHKAIVDPAESKLIAEMDEESIIVLRMIDIPD